MEQALKCNQQLTNTGKNTCNARQLGSPGRTELVEKCHNVAMG